MQADTLTAAERKWIKKVQAVLDACPSKRLGCYTIGDNNVSFFDKSVNEAWIEADPRKRRELDVGDEMRHSGSGLHASLTFPFNVDSRSG